MRVICRCALPLNDRLCSFFTRFGVSIITTLDNVFIASGSPERIEALSRSNLIDSVQPTLVDVARRNGPHRQAAMKALVDAMSAG